MKKILTSMALISLCGLIAQAEELKFVTVLSQPIGAFAQVESLNEERASKTLFVNFCNTSVNTGKIDVQGMVKMNELRLTGDNVQAGSATNKMNYQITDADGLELGKGGSLAGGKLLAKSANPQDVTVAASTNINTNSNFIAADIPSMTIAGSTKIVYPAESLVGSDVHWEPTTDAYRYNFKVDKDKGVIKDGTTEYKSFPIRTDKRGGECRCGNSRNPFGSRHCTEEWNTQTCSSQESPSERRVGTIFWRFNYDTCQWYEADPKGYESTTNWDKWVKWGTIPSHHNCQCKGYDSGSYNDSTASSFDQQYGNPRFKSGAINGNMVNESSASRSRSCRYDKILGYGNKYDGTISGTYDFANCKWNESANCYCSTTRADAPSSGRTSGYEDKTRSCSSDSKWGSKYDGTITARYYYGKGNCYWDQYYDEDCYCSSRAGAPTIKYSGYTERTRNCEDLPEYGSDYEGTFKDRYNHNTCSWENVSNTCKLKCSNSTYKSSHKSECCPGVSTSDSVCYKNCSRTVSAGTYSWKVISQNTGTCNAQRGCLNADSNACTKSCDKVHAGISCTKYSPSGSISLGTQWTSTTTVCSENTKTETYRCKNGW